MAVLLACAWTGLAAQVAHAEFRFRITREVTGTDSRFRPAAVADLDGDGLSDLVAIAAQQAVVAYGVSPTELGTPQSYFSSGVATVMDAAVGDLDHDGHLDIIVSANAAIPVVAVLYGDGARGFSYRHALRAPFGSGQLALADFNSDGWPDIVCGSADDHAVVFLSDGAGGFALRTDLPALPNAAGVGAADLDGDSRADVVLAQATGDSVAWLHSNGDGTFAAPVYLRGAFGARTVRIADATGDGAPDLLVAGAGDTRVVILPGDGAGGFGPAIELGGFGSPTSVAVGDLDGDHAPDLAVTDPLNGTLQLFRGGPGGFVVDRRLSTGGADEARIADLDGDGLADLLYGPGIFSSRLVLAYSTVAPLVAATLTLSVTPEPSQPGEPVRVEVQMTPPGATGRVVIRERARTLGFRLLDANGHASVPLTFDEAGLLPLVALYSGDDVFAQAASDPFQHEVQRGRVAITTEVLPTLPYEGQGTVFKATLSAVAPAAGDPGGEVQWWLDGAPFGSPVPVVQGVATSMLTRTLTGGVHLYHATFLGSRSFAPDSTADTQQYVNPPHRPVTLEVGASPTPSQRGEIVVLFATLSTPLATGTVAFHADGVPVGSAEVVAGRATVSHTFSNAPQTVLLRAVYSGDDAYSEAESPLVAHDVTLARARIALTAIPSTVVQGQPVVFRALAAPAAPFAGLPGGDIALALDDGAVVGTIALLQGTGLSQPVRGLPAGHHVIRARYRGDAGFAADSSETTHVEVLDITPRIERVADVPDDQGGFVRVSWRSPSALPGLPYVQSFEIWRRVAGATAGFRFEPVKSVPGDGSLTGSAVVGTAADSTATGVPYETFFVRAVTVNPLIYFDSAPDSGYSVDNLGPPSTARLRLVRSGAQAQLDWSLNASPEFREYRLHRGATSGFTPTPGNLLLTTTDTLVTVTADAALPWYALVSIDRHGNASRVLEVGPGREAVDFAPLLALVRAVDHLTLSWQLPAPGMSAIVYRGGGDGRWSSIAQPSADANGVLRFEDFDVSPGLVYQYRLGVLELGAEVLGPPSEGTTLVPELDLRAVWPLPVRDGVLQVALALPNQNPTTLELLDVTGRIVRREHVEGLGAGRHQYAFGTRGLRPGVYLLRMTHGLEHFTRRVVVLP